MELAQRSCPVPLLLLLLGLSTGRFGQKVHQRLVPPLSRNLLVDLCFLKHIPFPLFLLCIIILLLNFTLFFFSFIQSSFSTLFSGPRWSVLPFFPRTYVEAVSQRLGEAADQCDFHALKAISLFLS